MRATAVQCPNCLANLEFGNGPSVICPYCGSRVRLDADERDGSVHMHTHIHDEAELRRIEIEEERRRKQEEEEERRRQEREAAFEQKSEAGSPADKGRIAYRNKWRKGIAIWAIGFAVWILLSEIFPPLVGIMGGWFIFGPIAILMLNPLLYKPGEYAEKWRRALLGYFTGFVVLFGFSDFPLFSALLFIWLFICPILLFLYRPR